MRGAPASIASAETAVVPVELAGDARLVARVASTGGGELVIRGRGAGAAELGGFEVGAGETELEVAVPGPGLLELELRWAPRDGEALELRALELVGEPARERPPIVWISIDTLAARNLSVYGYARDTTPELAALAREAVVFERCATNATWTAPSFQSTLSGLFAGAHHTPPESPTAEAPAWRQWRLAEERWTLAECLAARGYATAAFVDVVYLTEPFGVAQGFEHFDASAADPSLPARDPDGGIRHIAPRVEAWLDARATEDPFFLFLHAFDVHGPYVPEAGTDGLFDGDALHADAGERPVVDHTAVFGAVPDYIARGALPDGAALPERIATRPIAADYDEGVRAMDAELGAFFDALRARGLWDECCVVVTADHGESLVEHDVYFGHGVLWEDVVRVPLLVKLPHGRGAGTRVEGAAQLVDLYPTLAELAGVELAGRGLHGRSLLAACDGRALEPVATYCESGLMEQECVELDGWKLIEMRPGTTWELRTLLTAPWLDRDFRDRAFPELAGAAPNAAQLASIAARAPLDQVRDALLERLGEAHRELYDLSADPHERDDLYRDDHPRLPALLEARERVRREIAAARVAGGAVELDEGAEQDLRDHGYGGD